MPSDAAYQLLYRVYVNWARGDFWSDGDIWHEDVELVFADSFLDASVHRGLAGLPDAFKVWLRVWDRWEAELEELRTAPDGRIVALCVFRGFGARARAPVLSDGAHVWTFDEHDLVTRLEIHRTRDEAQRILGAT